MRRRTLGGGLRSPGGNFRPVSGVRRAANAARNPSAFKGFRRLPGPRTVMAWTGRRGRYSLHRRNEEIAGQLVVSPLTVKTHVTRAMTKLSARDRAQASLHRFA